MGKELTTTVVLNGRATSGFTALADKVTQLGYVISQLGGQVGEWEKESLEIYKNYETYMLEAKGAMSATAKSASELERTYAALEEHAQEWASTTIFHTNDVAKAISEAAHAGWDYEKMLQGIPEAMVLAQAGNTDLSSGLDMLIKTINGTGIAFEDSGKFVDQWVMAANSSATTVSELGEAMEKMGATARFGDSTEELLTMLAVLANTGTVGSAAGT
ncbi:MAG: phage tail tape measure protein, partial [Clostridia bacterium]|nr:phage tail tape measure protein [Clostridia bacterium]